MFLRGHMGRGAESCIKSPKDNLREMALFRPGQGRAGPPPGTRPMMQLPGNLQGARGTVGRRQALQNRGPRRPGRVSGSHTGSLAHSEPRGRVGCRQQNYVYHSPPRRCVAAPNSPPTLRWGCRSKVSTTGWLPSHSRNSFSHRSAGWKSETRCPGGWFLLRAVRDNLSSPLSSLLRAPATLGVLGS